MIEQIQYNHPVSTYHWLIIKEQVIPVPMDNTSTLLCRLTVEKFYYDWMSVADWIGEYRLKETWQTDILSRSSTKYFLTICKLRKNLRHRLDKLSTALNFFSQTHVNACLNHLGSGTILNIDLISVCSANCLSNFSNCPTVLERSYVRLFRKHYPLLFHVCKFFSGSLIPAVFISQ